MISVELLMYLLVVVNHDMIEVVTTFLALFVISKLDEVFFAELVEGEITRRVVTEAKFAPLRTIQTTTSSNGGIGSSDSHQKTLETDTKASLWVNEKRKQLIEFYNKRLQTNTSITK